MARYIIKDGVRYTMEQSLFDNPAFREDMTILLTFFVIVPAIAAGGVFLSKAINDHDKSKKELIKEKTEKAVDMKNTLKATNLFNQKQR